MNLVLRKKIFQDFKAKHINVPHFPYFPPSGVLQFQ